MSDNKDISQGSEPTKYGALNMLTKNPLATSSNELQQPDSNEVVSTDDHEENGDFDNEDIQKKMTGVINNLQSRPVTPDESNKTLTNAELQRPQSPFVGEQAQPPSRITSPQLTKADTNVLVVDQSTSSNQPQQKSRKNSVSSSTSNDTIIDGDIEPAKSERPVTSDQKQNLSSSRSSNRQDQKPSNESSSRKSSPTKQPDSRASMKDSRRSSTTSSEHERLNNTKLSLRHTPTKAEHKQVHQPTDEERPSSRPQSPNVQQIADHNEVTESKKPQKNDRENSKKQNQSLRRNNTAESLADIPVVNDKSIDSTSESNSDSDQHKQKRIKTKNKDVETNTDTKNITHHTSSNANDQQQRKSTTPKSSKTTETTPNQHQSARRRSPTKELDSNENKKKSTDDEHHGQSDIEQTKTKKEPKRRRPKRISRTTQTYECVFRRMQFGEHEELLPTKDTDKNIQTRQSQLCPRIKSSKNSHPIYLSADAFKIEALSSKKGSQGQGNISSPYSKLLILRPTRSSRHTSTVNVKRITLQDAIELIRQESKRNSSTTGPRIKSKVRQPEEQTSHLPRVQSSSSSVANIPHRKPNARDKPHSIKTDNRTYRRKNGDAV